MQIAWELILSSFPQRAEPSKRVLYPETPPLATKTYYLTKTRDFPKAVQGGDHFAEHIGAREECILCRGKERTATSDPSISKTVWKCASCNLALCLNESRNCFKAFHV